MGGPASKNLIQCCKGIARLSGIGFPRVCIETGTYRGESTLRFATLFETVHTIELSRQWHEFSSARLRGTKNVVCHHGDSASILSQLLPGISEPVAVFLDAHYAGGSTAFGKEEVPLLRELETICERNERDVLIIDDMRLMGEKGACGFEGDDIYPPMEYDWCEITITKVKEIVQRNSRNTYLNWWDKLVVFRNQTHAQRFITKLMCAPITTVDLPLRTARRFARNTLRRN